MIPTPSAVAASLGLLSTLDVGDGARLAVEFGDFDHKDDRLWMRHAGAVKSLWARSRGADTKVVALSGHDAIEALVVRADSAIHYPGDLRGKRVALPRVPGRALDVDRHVYMMPLAAALTSAGLTMADVRVIDTEFERPRVQNPRGRHEPRNFFEHAAEVFTAQLLNGSVDAIVTPFAPPPCDGRTRTIYETFADMRLTARGELRLLTVSGEMMRQHREVVVDAVARLLRAMEWATGHREEALRYLALDLDVSEALLQARRMDFDEWCRIDWAPQRLAMLQARQQLMVDVGSICEPFPLDDWLDSTIVRDAQRKLDQTAVGDRTS